MNTNPSREKLVLSEAEPTWPAWEVLAAGRLPSAAGRAGHPGPGGPSACAVGAQPTNPQPAGTGTSSRRTCAPTPASFDFVKWQAGRRGGVPHAGAGQGEAEGALPLNSPGDRTARLVISHSKRKPHAVPIGRHPHRFGLLSIYNNRKWL